MVQENIDPTPITNPGDTKQKYTIAVIAIVAIFAITLLLFFAGSEVGQAIQFKSVLQVGEAGVLIEDGSIEKVGTVVKVPVKANLGDGKSTAFSFDLESKNGLDLRCQDLVRKDDDFFSNNGFSVIKDVNCDDLGNKVHVEYFWLCDGSDDECNLITGTVDLFEISVVADSIGAKGLEISNFQILDLDGNNLVNPEFIKRTVELNFAQCLENSDCDKSGIACIQNVCQKDSDSDGLLDANDNCPLVKNGNQLDSNKDGKGDACTVSVCSKENFAACNNVEECKNAKGVIVNDECVDDKDEDGVPSELDNCPEVKNAGSILTLTEGQSKSLVIDQRKFDVKVLKITDTEKIVSIDGNRFNLNNKRDINLEDGTSIILKSAQGVDFVYTGSSSGGGSGGSSSGDYLHSADKKCVADWVCEDWSV